MNRRLNYFLRVIHRSIRVCRATYVLILEVASLLTLLILVIKILLAH